MLLRNLAVLLALLPLGLGAAHGQLRGHGGPVRALAISPDGKIAVSGSFDTAAIIWSLQRSTAEQVLRFHDGAVNAVAVLPDGDIATAGADARIALWRRGEQAPHQVLEGHTAPIAGLSVAPDGRMLASASWDQTVRLWRLADGAAQVLTGHQQNVNAVAFLPDGNAVVSAGYDATLRIWPLSGAAAPIIVTLPTPLNAVAVAPDGEIVCAGADGKLYFVSAAGERRATMAALDSPVTALAISPNGSLVAAAGSRGDVVIVARRDRRIAHTLVGPGSPVWSAAFLPDNRTLLTGGADRVIRRWNAATGQPIDAVAAGGAADPLVAYAGDPGDQVFRACVACHTLRPDQGPRAGPTLFRIMGRRIATLPGYNFSPALKKLDITWTPETVAKLFEIGPATYTPGTKMPEQRITSASDRAALVQFLDKATR